MRCDPLAVCVDDPAPGADALRIGLVAHDQGRDRDHRIGLGVETTISPSIPATLTFVAPGFAGRNAFSCGWSSKVTSSGSAAT